MGNNNATPWWPTNSPVTSNFTPTSTYTPNFGSNGAITSILDSIGQYLKPQQAYTSLNPVNNFLAPQQAAFNQWATNYARPQFDYWTKNPFMQKQANVAAAGDTMYSGNGNKALNDSLKKLEMGYNSDISNQQTAYLQPFQDQYNKMMSASSTNLTPKV